MTDPSDLWRNQPTEVNTMTPELLANRLNQLRSEARRGIVGSAGVVLVIALISYWRYRLGGHVWFDTGMIVTGVWALASFVAFYKRIYPPPASPDALSAVGFEYYRSALMQARSHIQAMWAWGTPALLALGLFTARIATQAVSENIDLTNMAPFTLLVLIWIGVFASRTRARLQEIDKEIQALDALRS